MLARRSAFQLGVNRLRSQSTPSRRSVLLAQLDSDADAGGCFVGAV